jgi:hypothetical protein
VARALTLCVALIGCSDGGPGMGGAPLAGSTGDAGRGGAGAAANAGANAGGVAITAGVGGSAGGGGAASGVAGMPSAERDAGDGAAAGGSGAAGGADGPSGDAGTLDPRTAFPPVTAPDDPAPFATATPGNLEGPDASCSIHRPAMLGEGGLKHPVILWGMGTGGFNTYPPTFERWASQGFVVAAAILGNGQGDGVEMLACLDYVCEQYAPHVDCTRVGASGHSQGGGGAIMTGQDPRVITTAPIQPYIAQGFGGFDVASIARQTGVMLLLSGTADTIAAPAMHQQPIFDMTNVPVFWANLVDGDHVVTGIDGAASYAEITLAWFRLQLMNDEAFREQFYGASCAYCMDSAWIVVRDGID